MEKIKCPYCDRENSLEPCDVESGTIDECEHCGMQYAIEEIIEVRYEAEKLDCLNGLSDHKWQMRAFPNPSNSYVRCTVCEEVRRDLTPEEVEAAMRDSERVYGPWKQPEISKELRNSTQKPE